MPMSVSMCRHHVNYGCCQENISDRNYFNYSPSDGGDRLLAGVGDVLLLVLPRVVEDQGAASRVGDNS